MNRYVIRHDQTVLAFIVTERDLYEESCQQKGMFSYEKTCDFYKEFIPKINESFNNKYYSIEIDKIISNTDYLHVYCRPSQFSKHLPYDVISISKEKILKVKTVTM
jgi:hypothetical protein